MSGRWMAWRGGSKAPEPSREFELEQGREEMRKVFLPKKMERASRWICLLVRRILVHRL